MEDTDPRPGLVVGALGAVVGTTRAVLLAQVGPGAGVGEPTAHLQRDGRSWFDWPPSPETVELTLAEVNVPANVTLLDENPEDTNALETLARLYEQQRLEAEAAKEDVAKAESAKADGAATDAGAVRERQARRAGPEGVPPGR